MDRWPYRQMPYGQIVGQTDGRTDRWLYVQMSGRPDRLPVEQPDGQMTRVTHGHKSGWLHQRMDRLDGQMDRRTE